MTDALPFSLIAGVSVGFAAGYIGSLMVLKRMALVGDAMSHVALPGLALGILFGFQPFLGAFAFLFVAAVVTWYLEEATKLSVESIVGVLFVLALAIGILLATIWAVIVNNQFSNSGTGLALAIFGIAITLLVAAQTMPNRIAARVVDVEVPGRRCRGRGGTPKPAVLDVGGHQISAVVATVGGVNGPRSVARELGYP